MSNIAPRRLDLSVQHLEAMQRAAATADPEECCGLLIGSGLKDVTVTSVRQVANLVANRKTEFAVDPQTQFDVLRELRGGRHRIVGHYHSHPNGVSTPSARDVAGAHDPDAVWVIISVDDGTPVFPRAFVHVRDGDGFSEIPITISP